MLKSPLTFLALTSAIIAHASGSATGEYLFKGIFGTDDQAEVSIQCIGSSKAYWIREGQTVAGITVEKIDLKKKTVVIKTNDGTRKLHLAGEGQYDAVDSGKTEARVKQFHMAMAEVKKKIFTQIKKDVIANELKLKLKKDHPDWSLDEDGSELASGGEISTENPREQDQIVDNNFIEALKRNNVRSDDIATYAKLRKIYHDSFLQAYREFNPALDKVTGSPSSSEEWIKFSESADRQIQFDALIESRQARIKELIANSYKD